MTLRAVINWSYLAAWLRKRSTKGCGDIKVHKQKAENRPRRWTAYILLIFLAVFTVVGAIIGANVAPRSIGIPTIRATPLEISFEADDRSVYLSHIDSEISPTGYILDADVEVKGHKGVEVAVLYSYGRAEMIKAVKVSGTKLTAAIWHFKPGTSSLSLTLDLKNCHCLSYRAPYLSLQSALVIPQDYFFSFPGQSHHRPAYPVTISSNVIDRSVVNLFPNPPNIPADLTIISSSPPNGDVYNGGRWVWKQAPLGAGVQSLLALSLSAQDNLNRRVFYAGIILGLVGAALLSTIQEAFAARERSRQRAASFKAKEGG